MAAQDQTSEFDALEPVEPAADDDDDDAEWIDLDAGDSVVGEVREIKDNCGEYGNRVSKLSRGVGDNILMWGTASVDSQVDRADIGAGDVIGLKNTGQKYETDHENPGVRWEVRKK
jgi:hypothetical protein